MIDFNVNDFNLSKIRHESKLGNLITEDKYHIYGLRQKDNPPILIEYNYETIGDNFETRLNTLIKYFKSNGIDIETFEENEEPRVDIGLRKDLRGVLNKAGQPLFASSILSTIIYCLEGRMDLEQMIKYKLVNVPKLDVHTEETE